jgi:predicted membrane protein
MRRITKLQYFGMNIILCLIAMAVMLTINSFIPLDDWYFIAAGGITGWFSRRVINCMGFTAR